MHCKFEFTTEDARTVFLMEAVCHGESLGPDSGSLMLRLRKLFPEIAKDFEESIDWAGYEEAAKKGKQ